MKKLLIICLLAIAGTVQAQKKASGLDQRISFYVQDNQYKAYHLELKEEKQSDTLQVDLAKYKYLKIGDQVYKIEFTLKPVEKEQGVIWYPSKNLNNLLRSITPTDTTVPNLPPINPIQNCWDYSKD